MQSWGRQFCRMHNIYHTNYLLAWLHLSSLLSVKNENVCQQIDAFIVTVSICGHHEAAHSAAQVSFLFSVSRAVVIFTTSTHVVQVASILVTICAPMGVLMWVRSGQPNLWLIAILRQEPMVAPLTITKTWVYFRKLQWLSCYLNGALFR